jgi:glutamine amidotransferase
MNPMIAIIDYGAGNLKNVSKAFDYLSIENIITKDPSEIAASERIVLPGVGAFGEGMRALRESGLDKAIKKGVSEGKPLLGICLGMQMLFDESEESPGVEGLGILKGKIKKIPSAPNLKIPHMGWNDITCKGKLFEGLSEKPFMYFVHSYYLDAFDKSSVSATVNYGIEIEVAVEYKNVFATQFHPEKSGREGLKILSNFAKTEAVKC